MREHEPEKVVTPSGGQIQAWSCLPGGFRQGQTGQSEAPESVSSDEVWKDSYDSIAPALNLLFVMADGGSPQARRALCAIAVSVRRWLDDPPSREIIEEIIGGFRREK